MFVFYVRLIYKCCSQIPETPSTKETVAKITPLSPTQKVAQAVNFRTQSLDPFEDMKLCLEIVLHHALEFSNEVAEYFLDCPGMKTTQVMDLSSVIKFVSHKLSSLKMEVSFVKETEESEKQDGSERATKKDETNENGAEKEKPEQDIVKCEEGDILGKSDGSLKEIVNCNVSWTERATGFPRQLQFSGKGVTFTEAANDCSNQFFLHFDLPQELLKISAVLLS